MSRTFARRCAMAGLLGAALVGLAFAWPREAEAGQPEGPTSLLTTRELVEIKGLSGLAVSPDGGSAVVRVDHQDLADGATRLSWELIRLRDGRAVRLADAGAPRWNDNGYLAIETAQWSPDGAWIYFLKLSGEEVQLWRVSRSGGGAQQLTHEASDVADFLIGSDGRIHYAIGPATRDDIKAAEDAEVDNGVLQQRSLIVGFPVTHNFPVNGRMATLRRLPSVLGRTTLLGDEPLSARTFDPDLRHVKPAETAVLQELESLKAGSLHGIKPLDPAEERRRRSPVSRRIAAIISDGAPEDAPLARSRSYLSWQGEADQASRICRYPICLDADHIDLVGWTEDGEGLIFQTETFETLRLNFWDIASGNVRPITATDQVLGSYASGAQGACQVAGHEAICIAAAADKPPSLVAVDVRTGALRTLFDPNPNLSAEKLGVASKITLHDRFGAATIGHLILPRRRDGPGRLPLIITSYSCRGFLLGGSGRDVPEHVLANLGYASVCVDLGGEVVRRAAGFQWTQHNSELSGLDFFEDAVHVLNRQGIADPDRVVLTGFSGSATDTAFAITQSRAFTAALVTTEGSIDAIACYVAAAYRSCADAAQREGYTRPYDSRDGFLKYSPAWNAEKITSPLLMQLAEVEYVPMMQLYGAMLDYGRAVEMDIFPGAYHYKSQPRQRLAVYNRNVDWVNFWLRGEESADPHKVDQNLRWRAMREGQCKLFSGDGPNTRSPWYCQR